jgi:Cyclic nucleotide-binding domain
MAKFTFLRLDSLWLKRISPAAGFQFLFVAALALLKPAVNAMLLARFQAQALPFLYLGTSLISLGLALLPPSRAGVGVSAVSGGFASLVGILLLGIQSTASAGLWVLLGWLMIEVLSTQVALAFWKNISDSFDARESRRAFTSINGIGMSGAIAGGFLASQGAQYFSVSALIACGAALLGAGALVFRLHRNRLELRSRRLPPQAELMSQVFSQRYPRQLLFLVLGLAVLSPCIDFVFRFRVAQTLPEAGMASLFGAHQLWTGIFCVVFQLLASEQIIKRFGLIRYVSLLPLSLGVLVIVAWAWPSVWSVWLLKVIEGATSWSILPVAMQLLYAPLADGVREGARRLIDGVFRKAGLGIAALLILFLGSFLDIGFQSQAVFGVSLVLSLGLLASVWQMSGSYVEAIAARVSGNVAAFGPIDVSVLVELLSNPHEDKVLRAASLLEQANALDENTVRLLLRHSHERVQERGVHWALQIGTRSLGKELEHLFATSQRRPRDAAAWALAHLEPMRALEVLPKNLKASDIGLQCASVGGLLLVDPKHVGALRELNSLISRGPSAPSAERRELARLLGRLGHLETASGESDEPKLAATLLKTLDDTDATVRRVGIASVGTGHFVALAPKLLRFLSWRDERMAARAALTALGDEVVPLLQTTLNDRSRSLALRLQLPRVLKDMGTQLSFDALLFSNAEDEPSLHHRVGEALAQMNERHPDFTIDEAQRTEALERRRLHAASLVEPAQICRAALGKNSMLSRLLTDRIEQSLRVSFSLLGLLHGGRALRRAHAHLLGTDQKRAAWATEFLDATLTAQERQIIDEEISALRRAREAPAQARSQSPVAARREVESCARTVARELTLFSQQFRGGDMNEATLKKLFALEGVEIFAQSEIDDLTALAGVARLSHFAAGEQVYAEGDPGDALYVIAEGAVEARREGEVLLTLKTKESFGETSLFDGAPRINEVVALQDTTMLVIDRRDFLDLLADRPELLTGMFRVMSQQLKTMAMEVATRRSTTGDIPILNAPPKAS